MTITLTKRQLLALCFHIQPRQLASLDHVRYRRATWSAFGVSDLAADVAEIARSPRVNISLDWMDRTTGVTGELDAHSLAWLREVTKPPYEGPDADFLFDVHEKLSEAK